MDGMLNRREFVGSVMAAGSLAFGQGGQQAASTRPEGGGADTPVDVHVVYVGKTGAAWPKPAFDPKPEVALFAERLKAMQARLPDIRFVGGELVSSPEQAERTAKAIAKAPAVLLVHLSLNTLPEIQRIVEANRPTVFFSQPFSGHEWMFVQNWAKAGKRILLVPSRELSDVEQAVRLACVPARMSASKIVVVGAPDGTAAACSPEKVLGRLGTTVVPVSVEAMVKAHQGVALEQAEREAEQTWIGPARCIKGPNRAEIVKAARMYMAMRQVLREAGAQAITIRCLGGIPIDVLGYPCLGFARLLDQGLIGACEADMDSTITMLLFRYAFGVPGFITDPLFDLARNAVIHAHCTAPTRMDGPQGERAPFDIRTHTDDDRGAALEVQMRLNQVITCAKLCNLDTMILSTGKIIEVPDFDDRGCRTQITTQVQDARGMLDNWGGGMLDGWMPQLHRVVFYGDHAAGTRDLCRLMGFKVFEGM